ncbi:hypothetical protein LDC_0834 [sediment metagenome]|uniref:Uncharacterized protein n=1 Tax=sediment metagenome TaxID=749907 RepID=D9PH35_9ZZZZ
MSQLAQVQSKTAISFSDNANSFANVCEDFGNTGRDGKCPIDETCLIEYCQDSEDA